MTIVAMAAAHVAEVAAIERECFAIPWSAKALEEELRNPAARFFVSLFDGEVAGYIGCHVVLDQGYITNVAVKEAYRRRGVGKALVRHLQNAGAGKLSSLSLEVRQGNETAKKLYRSCGFYEAGTRKNFYRNPAEDGIIMNYEYR